MLCQTEGIVLRQYKYTDNSRIIKIFTKTEGKKSFIVYGGQSKSSRSKIKILQPLFNVEIVFYKKNNASLLKAKQLSLRRIYPNIISSVKKMSVIMFLAEIIDKVIRDDQKDELLFDFIEKSIEFFDLNDTKDENFHIFFLIKLTKILGFYPLDNYSAENKFFNIKEGYFTSVYNPDFSLIDQENEIFAKILRLEIADYTTITIAKKIRNGLLAKILQFYSYHFENFSDIKSLEVLKRIFE